MVAALVAAMVISTGVPVTAQESAEGLGPNGTGTIVVVTEPAEEIAFTFKFPFPPDVGVSSSRGVSPGSPWASSRRPGSYVVELISRLPATWEVTDVTCIDGGGPTTSSGNVAARSATFGIDPGEDVTCTFTLSQGHGTIVVETDPPGGDVSLEFDFPFPPDFGGSTSRFVGPDNPWREKRAARSYTVSMLSDPKAWELTEVSCDDSGSETPSTGDADAATATFGIDPEEEVTCTFTVSQGRGTIKLESDPHDDDLSLNFRFPLPPDIGAVFNRTVEPGGSWTEDRHPGSYLVTMTTELPEPWELKSIDCEEDASERPSSGDVGAAAATYGLDPGEHVTCTWKLRDPTMPHSGPWRVNEVSNRATCSEARVEKELNKGLDEERSGPTTGNLRVTDRGNRIIATGAQRGRLVLRRVSREEGIYRTRKNRARIEWVVRSPERITGTNTVSLGQGCKIKRKFDMRYLGD